MFLGSIKAYYFHLLASLLGVGSILACYLISQQLNHEKPFPNTGISATAKHYPQFIFFRIGTITGSVFTVLSHIISYFWIMTISFQNTFNINKYRPQLGTVMAVGGALFLMGSGANIDTGKQNTDWHLFCAVNSLVWGILSFCYHTFLCFILHANNTNSINQTSLVCKVILCGGLLIQAWLQIQNNYIVYSNERSNILEFTISFSIYAFIILMGIDVKDFTLIHRLK